MRTLSRILLIIPPGPQPTRSPLLSVRYLAATLLRAGHEVRVLDLAAPFGPTPEQVARVFSEWDPRIIGVGLYTESALAAYDFLRQLPPGGALRVAGGPHATAVPGEPLARGFDLVVRGEGERTLLALADLIAQVETGTPPLEENPGLTFRAKDGAVRHTPDAPRVLDLDAIPPPHHANPLFDRRWYAGNDRDPLPAELMTSRGCPGRCTFCANIVTGRVHRTHSTSRVMEEMAYWITREKMPALSFYDDAFTADRKRVRTLCRAVRERFDPLPSWWCESRIAGFDSETAAEMKAAGCAGIVFGVESGDPDILARIGKGHRPQEALSALRTAREAGLITIANMMFGFPDEGESHLGNTLSFMGRMAPFTDYFSAMGILVPYPGTAIYEGHARRFGFAGWWLDRAGMKVLIGEGPPRPEVFSDYEASLAWIAQREEAVLEADFFHYSKQVKTLIRTCLEFRRDHNRQAVAAVREGRWRGI
ncbi:MAG: radical SAM protein [Deltaproteobacteria bacterium]|nr:radical SAM protein [Deltaproteobacteria bacterium]